jgi:bile acid:Na+ symporter, BASS family
MTITELIGLGIHISIALTVFSFGLSISLDDTLYLFRRPGLLFRTLLSMNVLMPLFVILMALIFNLPPLIRATLIALSVSPVPPLFHEKSVKAGGRESYIAGLLVASALFAIVLIPATFLLLEQIFHRSVEVPVNMITEDAVKAVILPLGLGILLKRLAPVTAAKFSGPLAKIALILLLVCVLPLMVTVFPSIRSIIGNGTILAIVAFVLAGVTIGHFLGGPDKEDRTVLALSTAMRHPGIVAVLVNANQADHQLVPAAITLYLLISGIIMVPYLKWLGREKRQTALRPEKTIQT